MREANETISRVLLLVERHKGSLEHLRSSVLRGEYTATSKNFSRLLLWKACLITETLHITAWRDRFGRSRAVYHELRKRLEMSVPWHLLDPESALHVARSSRFTKPERLPRVRHEGADPLAQIGDEALPDSLNTQTSHNALHIMSDSDLLRAIVLDIERLFPGDPFLHGGSEACLHRKRLLVSILYVWARAHPEIGYRQGLHEVLGLMFRNIAKELVHVSNPRDFSPEELQILSLYDANYLEHDLYTLMDKFVVFSGLATQFYGLELDLWTALGTFNGYLMKVDQIIHYNLLTKLRLESELWAIRYFRLILLRELGLDLDVPSSLWDGLIAAESAKTPGTYILPDLIMFVVIVVLVHVKSELTLCDFSEALSLLLHYPISTRLTLYPTFIDDLFKDAYALLNVKDKDLKLYEYGLRLNKKYAGLFKVNVAYLPRSEGRALCSPKSSVELPRPADTRRANMAFEKLRLEMRLKKRAQEMLENSPGRSS